MKALQNSRNEKIAKEMKKKLNDPTGTSVFSKEKINEAHKQAEKKFPKPGDLRILEEQQNNEIKNSLNDKYKNIG